MSPNQGPTDDYQKRILKSEKTNKTQRMKIV